VKTLAPRLQTRRTASTQAVQGGYLGGARRGGEAGGHAKTITGAFAESLAPAQGPPLGGDRGRVQREKNKKARAKSVVFLDYGAVRLGLIGGTDILPT